MIITTTDKSVKIQEGVLVWTGGLSTFTFTYSTPADSITFYKGNKLIATGRLSNSTINGTQLTESNIDTELDKVFKTATGGSVVESDPVFTEWKNGDTIAAGNGANVVSSGIAIGKGAYARSGGTTVGISATGYGVAIGASANAGTDTDNIAIGYRANASAANSISIGSAAGGGGRGANSIQIGMNTSTTNLYSIALGDGTKASNTKEIAVGYLNNTIQKSASNTEADATHLGIASFNSTASVRKNVIEARQNDDIYIWKDGSQIKLQDNLGGGSSPKILDVTDTLIRLSADSNLIYKWSFGENVPLISFTMEEDVDSAAINTTNSATIILINPTSGSITITLPANLVWNSAATYYVNGSVGMTAGSEASVTSFTMKAKEMKIINVYGFGLQRIMEIDY